jgi:hypothetical protein
MYFFPREHSFVIKRPGAVTKGREGRRAGVLVEWSQIRSENGGAL